MKTGIRRVHKHPITAQKVVKFTFDSKKYTEGLPEMKWSGGKVVE